MAETLLSIEYNRQNYYPPMPVLQIGLSRPGVRIPDIVIEGILDTGADNTILPFDILERIAAPNIDRLNFHVRGITGERQRVDIYSVTLYLGETPIFGVRAAALESSDAIIGRDILNQLQICLIGPALTAEVLR
ncbi:MAG: hypothetical protein KF753_14080 [Caldilineaceae bacterium]|nr:hypothetical protein [Caldilineaceae bacterium]